MNLYLRLLLVLLRARFLPKLAIHEPVDLLLRVWPNDVDVNLHMNNGRFLTVIDLALVELFSRTGFLKTLLRHKWRPMLGGAIISYRKQLKPFERYRLRFRYLGSDSNWNIMSFEFIRSDGRIAAKGLVKGGAVSKAGIVPTATAWAMHRDPDGSQPSPARLPPAAASWLAAEQQAFDLV